jgi:high-affinity Fe2+/Pb2+ permease
MSTPTIEQPAVEAPAGPETYTLLDLYAEIETLRPIAGWSIATAAFAVNTAIAVGMTGYALGHGDHPNWLRIVAGVLAALLAAVAFRNLQRARRTVGAGG